MILLVLQLSLHNLLKPVCSVENEDVVGAAPAGDAPTTSEWSTSLLPTKVHMILRGLMAYPGPDTVWCRYNAANFITNIHKRHPMARPLGRGMGCLLWIQHLIDIMSQFLQLLMQKLTILDRVITALDCIVITQPADTTMELDHQQPQCWLGSRAFPLSSFYGYQ